MRSFPRSLTGNAVIVRLSRPWEPDDPGQPGLPGQTGHMGHARSGGGRLPTLFWQKADRFGNVVSRGRGTSVAHLCLCLRLRPCLHWGWLSPLCEPSPNSSDLSIYIKDRRSCAPYPLSLPKEGVACAFERRDCSGRATGLNACFRTLLAGDVPPYHWVGSGTTSDSAAGDRVHFRHKPVPPQGATVLPASGHRLLGRDAFTALSLRCTCLSLFSDLLPADRQTSGCVDRARGTSVHRACR